MSAAQHIHNATEDLTAARKLVEQLEEQCRLMGNSQKLNPSGVVALYEVTKKLEDIDNLIFDALKHLEN